MTNEKLPRSATAWELKEGDVIRHHFFGTIKITRAEKNGTQMHVEFIELGDKRSVSSFPASQHVVIVSRK